MIGFKVYLNSLPAITNANSLDPDQAQQNVGADLDPNCLTDGIPDFFLKKNYLEKISR